MADSANLTDLTAILPAMDLVPHQIAEIDSAVEDEAGPKASPLQVASEQAEAFITEKRIGERIKHLRLKKTMGLVELGKHTGLSASFLSQLETGRVVPTLRNLARIAMVFSKDLSYFFEPEPQKLLRIHRSKDRTRLPQSGVEDPTYFFESLGFITPERNLDPYYAEFVPQKAGAEAKAHQHAGNEFLYVIDGELDVRHGDELHRVGEGDGIYFDASTIHSYLCAGDVVARAIIIVTMQPAASEAARTLSRISGAQSRMKLNRQAS